MEKILVTLIFVGGLIMFCKYLFAYLTFCKQTDERIETMVRISQQLIDEESKKKEAADGQEA